MAARLLAILEMDVFLYLGRGQEVLITEASNSFVNLQRPLDFSFRSKTNQMDGVHWTEIIVFGSVTRRPVLSESFFCFVSRVLRLLLSSFSVHNFNYFPSEKKRKKRKENRGFASKFENGIGSNLRDTRRGNCFNVKCGAPPFLLFCTITVHRVAYEAYGNAGITRPSASQQFPFANPTYLARDKLQGGRRG